MDETLHTFGSYAAAERDPRQWFASFLASTAIYTGLVITVVTVGSATKQMIQEKATDLTFVEKVVKEEPPPPPVAIPEKKPETAAALAPVVRPDQKVRRLDKPPPPKEMVAPKDMPTEAPQEVDPSLDKGIAVYGDGPGDPAGLEGGQADGIVGGQVGGAIALPEDAQPPVPSAQNRKPPYPQEAKAAGRQATVILKVYILADGSVAKVEVMRGDEPFVAAALQVVKTWKFEPARYKGQAITIYQTIQIPFRLTA